MKHSLRSIERPMSPPSLGSRAQRTHMRALRFHAFLEQRLCDKPTAPHGWGKPRAGRRNPALLHFQSKVRDMLNALA